MGRATAAREGRRVAGMAVLRRLTWGWWHALPPAGGRAPACGPPVEPPWLSAARGIVRCPGALRRTGAGCCPKDGCQRTGGDGAAARPRRLGAAGPAREGRVALPPARGRRPREKERSGDSRWRRGQGLIPIRSAIRGAACATGGGWANGCAPTGSSWHSPWAGRRGVFGGCWRRTANESPRGEAWAERAWGWSDGSAGRSFAGWRRCGAVPGGGRGARRSYGGW